jgi:hypothetical protein
MMHTPQNTEENTLQTLLKIKAEAEKQLSIIEKTIKDIQTPTQPELTRDTGYPNIYGCNISLTPTGEVFTKRFEKEFKSDFDAYNSYLRPSYAETEAAYTLASRRVRAFAKAVNGDWKADWIDTDQEKYGIIYNENTYDARFRRTSNEFIHQIAFPTEELAAKALELFRPEWEILSNP